jgi:hypothetical protein
MGTQQRFGGPRRGGSPFFLPPFLAGFTALAGFFSAGFFSALGAMLLLGCLRDEESLL